MKEQKLSLQNLRINQDTVLFLDRDGVINQRIPNDYVKSWDEFVFLPKVKEALAIFTTIFSKIFVVTNQQGIGKGLMKEEMLHQIHQKMSDEFEKVGGHIRQVYYAPELHSENPVNRKPAIGMALQAKAQFPDIDLQNAIMIGDSESDIAFGHNAGMQTIFIENHSFDEKKYGITPDYTAKSLFEIAQYIQL